MARNRIKKPHMQQSAIKDFAENKLLIADLKKEGTLLISLRHVDKTQGTTWYDWEKEAMLGKALDTLHGYSAKSLKSQAVTSTFTIYKGFPPKEKTDFVRPKYVPEDAKWSRIHVDGVRCLIGHVVEDTFYLVFLDSTHSFWKVEKKNT